MKMNVRAPRELVQEGNIGPAPARVVQFKRRPEPHQALCHAEDRAYTDAAGDQYRVTGVLVQWEMIARRADFEFGADMDLVVNMRGSPTAGGIELYGDSVGRCVVVG